MKKKRKIIFFFFIFPSNGHRWNEIDSGKPETCSSATLSNTNATWTDPGSNPHLRGGKPATNRLSHGTTFVWCLTGFETFKSRPENTTGVTQCLHFLPCLKLIVLLSLYTITVIGTGSLLQWSGCLVAGTQHCSREHSLKKKDAICGKVWHRQQPVQWA